MYRRQIHEEHGYSLYPVGIEGGDGGCLGAEAACGHDRHRMAHRIERRHAGQHVGYRRQHDEGDVDVCEDIDHSRGAGRIAAARQRAQLHVRQTHAHLARLRNYQQQEHHHPESSDEVRGRTPEQQAVGKGLHIAEDGPAAGGIAAHRLENRIGKREGAAPEHIREQAEEEGQQPRERDDHIALAQRYRIRLAHEDEGEDAHDEGYGERNHQGRERRIVAVRHRYEYGEQHEQRIHQQGEAYVPYDYLPVHLFLSSLTRRRSCWFSPASSEMPSLSSTSWSSPSNFTVYFLSLDL